MSWHVPSSRKKLTGIRFALFIGGFVSFLGLAIYPIIIDPFLNPKKYQEIQKITRADIIQEDIQPGNMKVWSDPFDRKKKKDENAEAS